MIPSLYLKKKKKAKNQKQLNRVSLSGLVQTYSIDLFQNNLDVFLSLFDVGLVTMVTGRHLVQATQ